MAQIAVAARVAYSAKDLALVGENPGAGAGGCVAAFDDTLATAPSVRGGDCRLRRPDSGGIGRAMKG